MKQIQTFFRNLLLLLILLTAISSHAQNPTYYCVAKNDTLLNATNYQFDIYLYRTGTVDLYLNNYQFAFKIQNTLGILNGGTLTGVYLAGSSELPAAFISQGVNILTSGTEKYIRINGCPSSSNGTLIPDTGIRLGTFRITNTVSFGQSKMNMIWNNGAPATMTLKAMVSGASTFIFNMSYYATIFTDPTLNKHLGIMHLTGSGNYCMGNMGREVKTDSSENGVQYRLVKNANAIGSFMPGTDSVISFGIQTAGTYRSYAYRKATYLNDTLQDTVIITQSALPPTPVISQNGNDLYSSALAGNQWYNDLGIIAGADAQNYSPTTEGNYYCVVTDALGCISDTSNIIGIVFTSVPESAHMTVVRLWPNPSDNIVNISSEVNSEIEIYDLQGQLIKQLTTGSIQTVIDISSFSEGMYFVKIKTEAGYTLQKLIKK
ncbi:MAG: T9SS type A sorting domain-containing protein [Bacteroidota bacterium]